MINKKIDNYISENFDNWHTPGHKGMLDKRDITELMDGKYFPDSSITDAQNAAAEIYGCKQLRFLTNGSSIGIKAAIMAAAKGGVVLTGSNNHQAVDEGLQLAGAKKIELQNLVKAGLSCPLSNSQIDEALNRYPEIDAVLITSPDYYGKCCDIKIAETVKKHGKILIADSAHGAHFAAHPQLNKYSFANIADFCNMSAHKTLNAYTQTAYLAINNDKLINKADYALKLLGTTSPSYIFLRQLELAAKNLSVQKDHYDRLKQYRMFLAESLPLVENEDFTRIVVDCAKVLPNITDGGFFVAKKLFDKKIMAELFCGNYIVFIATPNDTLDKFKRLAAAIKQIRI